MNLKPVVPFEPIRSNHLPSGENWVAQIKWDGVRVLTYCDGTDVRLFNRKLNERTLQYPEFTQIEKFCSASSVILDGEMIAFDHSKPSFHEIMKRDSLRRKQPIDQAVKQIPVTYMIFDVLYYNGNWVAEKPLMQRQQILENIVQPTEHVQIVGNFPDGGALLEAVRNHNMEGVVLKDLTSTYVVHGKDGRWQKKKIFLDLFAAVGGVTFRGNVVNALLLGLYDDQGRLTYIGHAGTGKLTHSEWHELTARIQPLMIADKTFCNNPERSKEAVWIRPEIVVKVQFLQWTPAQTMRQPSIQAIVAIPIGECNFTQIN